MGGVISIPIALRIPVKIFMKIGSGILSGEFYSFGFSYKKKKRKK